MLTFLATLPPMKAFFPQEEKNTPDTPPNVDVNNERLDYLELRVDELESKLAELLERLR